MSSGARRSPGGFLAGAYHRPRVTLAIAAIIVACSAAAITRLRPSASLESMIDRDDPAAAALARITERFAAVDELLVVATASAVPPQPMADAKAQRRKDAKEENGFSSPLSASAPASASVLLDFAQRFHVALLSTAPPGMIGRVTWGLGADSPQRRFVEQVIVPNGVLYLDEAQMQALRERLEPASVREQIRRNEEAIAVPGPAADAAARAMLRDPLRLREILLGGDAPRELAEPLGLAGDGAFLSRDGRSLLIRIGAGRSPSDLEFTAALLEVVGTAVEMSKLDGVTVEYGGAYAIAATSARSIRADMVRSVFCSIALMQIVFLLAYRRVTAFPLAFLPVAAGIVTAFGLFALLGRQLTPVTAVIGAILAGLGIDAAIHYLSHFEGASSQADAKTPGRKDAKTNRKALSLLGALASLRLGVPDRSCDRALPGGAAVEQAVLTTARLLRPIGVAAATSVVGFVAIAASGVQALRDFALLGALGLASSVVAVLLVLPALLIVIGRRGSGGLGTRLHPEPVIRFVERRAAPCIGVVVVLWIGAALVVTRGGSLLPVESDLAVMHPRPNPALELQHRLPEMFGAAPDALIVHLRAEAPDELVARAHAVRRAMAAPAVRDAGIAGAWGIASLLPDPANAERRRGDVRELDAAAIVADVHAALEESLFDAAAHEPFLEFLGRFLRPGEAPSLDALRAFPALGGMLLPRQAEQAVNETVVLLPLQRPLADRAARRGAIETLRGALAGISGATLTGISVVGHDTERAVRADLGRLLAIAGAAVVIVLVLHLRRLSDVVLALLPALVALTCGLAVLRLAGEGLNMINLVGLPLLVGIAVDDGIFVMSTVGARARRGGRNGSNGLGASLHAITMTSVTTGVAFGSLIFTSTPAIQSLGRMTASGIAAAYIATLLLLVPILALRRRRLERER